MKRKFFKIPFMKKMIGANFTLYEKDDIYACISSGEAYGKTHYLFLDYDDIYPLEEAENIVEMYGLKKAIIVASSPKRYQLLSFSPMPWMSIFEIMYKGTCDKRHAAQMLRKGYVDLRISAKPLNVRGYPKVVKTIKNDDGDNFYNFYYEDIYRILIRNSERLRKILQDEVPLDDFIKRLVRRNRDG